MAKYKLKKGQTIGALAAESDNLLNMVFVDNGLIENLNDTNKSTFLIRGRTGTGKTALLKYFTENYNNVSNIDPDELSMQYLHGNQIIKNLIGLGVHFDIFFKYLWKHICIVELIKLRFDKKDDRNKILEKLTKLFTSNPKKTQELALEYLRKHGTQYWVTADTHVKEFTNVLETKLTQSVNGGVSIGNKILGSNGKFDFQKENNNKTECDIEIINRTQEIVNEYQISALNEVVKELGEHIFNDTQDKYYLLIDDLDKNWMPDDEIYLELLKSLLFTVKELNQKLKGLKIIVALRSNIFFRVFKKTKIAEPQREKWNDVAMDLIWDKSELEEMVNRRLNEVFRGQYDKRPPTITEIFPRAKKKSGTNAWDYLLERTFLRPRDVLDFFNTIIKNSDWDLNFTWKNIETAELEYSKRRLDSLIDEWKSNYFGLPSVFSFLRKKKGSFSFDEFCDDDLLEILTYTECNKCEWLFRLFNAFENETLSNDEIKKEIFNALYLTGIIGSKSKYDHQINYSFDSGYFINQFTLEELNTHTFIVHKMFRKALGIQE